MMKLYTKSDNGSKVPDVSMTVTNNGLLNVKVSTYTFNNEHDVKSFAEKVDQCADHLKKNIANTMSQIDPKIKGNISVYMDASFRCI